MRVTLSIKPCLACGRPCLVSVFTLPATLPDRLVLAASTRRYSWMLHLRSFGMKSCGRRQPWPPEQRP